MGSGYGTPILEGNKIFSHTRKDNAEYVVCINKQSGKILWSEMYETKFTIGGGGEKHGKVQKPTLSTQMEFYTPWESLVFCPHGMLKTEKESGVKFRGNPLGKLMRTGVPAIRPLF